MPERLIAHIYEKNAGKCLREHIFNMPSLCDQPSSLVSNRICTIVHFARHRGVERHGVYNSTFRTELAGSRHNVGNAILSRSLSLAHVKAIMYRPDSDSCALRA
jgi:hypothetical protein